VFQVRGNGVRPGIQAAAGQVLATATISCTVSPLIAPGEVFGRLDRGSNAPSPSARYRATSRDTQPCDTP
jgi:hypothetical protein